MIYLYGIILSMLSGLSNPVTKGLATKIQTKYCLFISSWFNLIGAIIVYFLVFNKEQTRLFDIRNLGVNGTFILILYLAFRIFSNVSQTKLFSKKDININILNIMLSCIFFITMLIDIITGVSYGLITVIGFVLSLIGIIIITLDFKTLKFYFTKDECLLLFVAYICAGTKPLMAKYLLNYIPLFAFGVMECLNYVLIYTLYNLKDIHSIPLLNKKILLQFIIQALIGVCCVFIQFKVITDVKIYIMTSFLTPVFTAIFAYLINKELINKKSAIGILIILIGICVAKLSY